MQLKVLYRAMEVMLVSCDIIKPKARWLAAV